MASNSAFFDAFFPNVVANATVPSGSFSEDVAAALVFAAADATNAIPSPRLENVKLVVKTKRPHKRRKRGASTREERKDGRCSRIEPL